MIPRSLTLTNFMSYGDEPQTLSFEGLHVACLSGDNGNGKSALLDAMTWALWGKTRASAVQSVSEDDLIRRSADDMEVRLEFELSGETYRVVKKRRRGKPGDWQFAQAVEGGQFVAIGGGGTREVGKQISQLLSMEYETFLASAYLQQGHADEFTRQKPAQRKQILGEILGLEQYDRLEAKARERSRTLKALMDDLDGQIRVLEAQVSRREDSETGLAQVRADVLKLEQARADQDRVAAELREKRIKLDHVAQQHAEMAATERILRTELSDAESARVQQAKRVREVTELAAQRDAIVRDYQALVQARQRREQLEPEIQELNRKSADLQVVNGAIDIERTRLQGEEKALRQQLIAADRQAAELERVQTQIAALEPEVAREQELLSRLAACEIALEETRARFEALKSRNRELTETLTEMAEVLDLLRRPQAACPVCDTDLTGPRREAVLARQTARQDSLRAGQTAVQRDGAVCKRELEAAQASVKELLAQRDAVTRARSRMDELVRMRETLACLPDQIAQMRSQAASVAAQLAGGQFAEAKQVHRKRLEQEIARLGLAKAEYETVVARARTLAEADLRHDRLREAEQHLRPEQDELDRRSAACAAREAAVAAHRARMDAFAESLRGLDAVRAQSEAADRELARYDGQIADQRRREGGLIAFLEDCDRAAVQNKEKEAERKAIHQEQWTYERLASCFGKKGIQALIIENAIPELEEEANDLLARMTDNGMQVRFLTTRAGKTSKSEIETLDITITDDVGPRPYELFSGGEAFRVNFAIRIALSRLLAHRSGARLQTLILDEGFGTQDGKGREKLVEAIEAVKGDFAKILVITHVEELKDSFAQRIEVTKDERGSRIYVY